MSTRYHPQLASPRKQRTYEKTFHINNLDSFSGELHNHPSGDPTPSEADIAVTEQMRQAGAVLGISLHDHLVIGKSRELSFRSEGYL